jgi:hypothetical protein
VRRQQLSSADVSQQAVEYAIGDNTHQAEKQEEEVEAASNVEAVVAGATDGGHRQKERRRTRSRTRPRQAPSSQEVEAAIEGTPRTSKLPSRLADDNATAPAAGRQDPAYEEHEHDEGQDHGLPRMPSCQADLSVSGPESQTLR